MGIEQSSMMHSEAPSVPTTKPNKIKRYNHFHSKPSHVIDLIVNQDWQKLIIATKTHQKEIFVAQKVRLFGVDRKVLPIHLACAMSPPSEVVEALINADSGFTTVKTPMKNYKKKVNRNIPFTGGGGGGQNSLSSRKMDIAKHHHSSVSNTSKGGGREEKKSSTIATENDDVDVPPSLMTPTTEPLSSFDNDDLLPHYQSVEARNEGTSNNVFFPEHNQDYALQITPSGDVRQISPSGYYRKSTNDTESPFVYLSQPDEVNPTYLSNLSDEFLPLHIACLFKASPVVINLLIKAYPKAVECKNKWGMLPIHIVCANIAMETPKIAAKKPVDEFTAKRYLNNLVAVTISDIDDSWDIHRVVDILVDAYPQSLNISSDNVEWLTPIEYVGKNFASGYERDKLLNLLKRKRHMAAQEGTDESATDSYGRLNNSICYKANQRTMLYSYLKMKDWDSADQQLQQNPEEASCLVMDKEYDSSGVSHLPLHLACSNEAPTNLIHSLSQAYPDGIKAKGKNGSNPLHIACKKSLCEEIIVQFINDCPEAICQKDEFGRIPLHLACKSNLPLSILDALIRAYPESCTVKDYNGHTALTYYCSENETDKLSRDQASALFERYGGRGVRNDEFQGDDLKN